MSPKKQTTQHLKNAFFYSCCGLKEAYRSEVAFKQDICVCAILFVLSLLLPVCLVLKIVMVMSLFFVLIAELINTAIETIIDRISLEIHPLSKKAKDIGSALVFLSFIQVVFVFLASIIAIFI